MFVVLLLVDCRLFLTINHYLNKIYPMSHFVTYGSDTTGFLLKTYASIHHPFMVSVRMIVLTSYASCNLWLQFLMMLVLWSLVWFCNIHSLKIASFVLEILRIFFFGRWWNDVNIKYKLCSRSTHNNSVSSTYLFCRACSWSSLLLPDVVVTGTHQIMPTKISRFIDWGGWYLSWCL